VLLAATVMYGQTPATKKAAVVKKPAASSANATATKKPAHHVRKANPATAAASTAAPAEGMTPPAATHKRDPFVNPIQAVKEGRSDACSGGKRCLAVNEIVLRGVVKSVNGMIAVVENSAQRTYFLHENDPIFNGVVRKITPDSVVFQEH